jgi:hypothetical protein
VAKEKFRSLSDASADGARQLVVSEMEHREQFKELSLLRAWGAEVCLFVASPSRMRSHMSTRMQVAALRHTEMVGEVAAFQVSVSSAMELVPGCSSNETFQMEVGNEPISEFWRLEEQCSGLEGAITKICNLLLRLPPGQARWDDRLGEAARRLEAELGAWRKLDDKLTSM